MTIVEDEEQDTDISVKDHTSTDTDTEIDVQGELGLSIMSGLITGELGGQFKKGERKQTNAVRGTATIKAKTVKKSVDLCDSLVAPLIDPRVNSISATHIVTGITYGANVYILFEDENRQNDNIQEVRGKLEGTITKFASLVKGSLTGSISNTDNLSNSNRNLRVKIKGDIGFQNAGVPVSEDELLLFVQNLNVHVNVAEQKYGRPIIYHLSKIDNIISDCIEHATNSGMTKLEMHEIEIELNREVYRLFQSVQDKETDAENIWAKIKRFRHCVSQQLFNQLRNLKDAFDVEISSYRRSLQQAIIKARAGNSTLLKSGTGDLLQKNRFINLYHSFEGNFTEYQESFNKLDFFFARRISCINSKHTIEDTIFQSSDKTVFVFLYNQTSYTEEFSNFTSNAHELVDSCSNNGHVCFVVDCDQRNDKCDGYDMNSILLYIRGQLKITSVSESNPSVEDLTSPIVSDLSDRIIRLEKSNRRVVKLLHQIAHDQKNFEQHTNDHEKLLGMQVSYTYVYQKYIFEYILDGIIAKEWNLKIATGDLQAKDLGGTNLTKYCRPRGYTHILSNIQQVCTSEVSANAFAWFLPL
ncbi:unnamed protein product [Allacma fusca]|uniref:Uncharacterized protein n=1 Tax=Allacma fusca TaxID=39272 RepID=A0A8J2NKV3_9HEXA|nr:unnamed protein product [Allacma fusca]